jgi:outer membrane protein assembly factor BamB/tetratricopeptide (TPR) repeat protein
MFPRRRLTDLGVFLFLAAVCVAPRAAVPAEGPDEVKPGVAKPRPDPGDPPPATLKPLRPAADGTADRSLARRLQAAEDYARAEDWKSATQIIQQFLDRDDDVLVRVPRKVGNQETVAVVSLKHEARRLLAALPAAGRDFYASTYGPRAAELLKEARDKNDAALLRRVVERYLYTDAGPDALQDLAALHADRGEQFFAALYYERLLQHRGLARWTPAQLFHASAAFRVTGDADNGDTVRRELLGRAATGAVPIGKRQLTRDELQKELDKLPAPGPLTSWPMPGGNPQRNAQVPGGPPFLEKNWWVPLTRTNESKQWVKQVEELLQQRGQPVIPGAVPISAMLGEGDKKVSLVVFRSHWGTHAIDTHTGKFKWEVPSAWSLDRLSRDPQKVAALNEWVNRTLRTQPAALLENSTIGTLSTDGKSVFAVDDFDVPPPPRADLGKAPAAVRDQLIASRLQAYELRTGKLRWEVGGHDEKAILRDCLFLGPPLPLDGRLYAVIETARPRPEALLLACPALAEPSLLLHKARELRLVTLDAATGHVLATRALGYHAGEPTLETLRRTQALAVAYGKGVLVCPTNVGTVVGVDLLSGDLLWSYTYRDADKPEERPDLRKGLPPGWQIGPDGRPFNPNPSANVQWKAAPPVVVGDRVVFAATDADKVHCVNLKDGSPVWSQPRKADDLYFAGVFADRVVIVGKGYARAVSLAKGEDLWRVETGMPSGYGAAGDNVYYLPLKDTAKGQGPEICAVDITKGQVIARTRSRKKGGEETAAVPGNLLFFDRRMLSQTATEIASFPLLAERLKEIDDALKKKKPDDPAALFLRGQLRLERGDLAGAVEDLRAALKNKPDENLLPKVRAKLYEAFTDYFQRDFDKAEKYLPEYEELCPPPAANDPAGKAMTAAARQRRSDFLVLVGTGREKQGKLTEALHRYLDLAALDNGELVPLVSDPAVKVRRDVWARGRIDEMMKRATPEQRKQLEEEMLKRFDKSKSERDTDALRRFAAAVGPETAAGREARLELAARLMNETAWLEAELAAEQVRRAGDETSRAKAVHLLAQINTRRGRFEEAVYFYRLLKRDHAKTKVGDDKTGADLFDELQTDKRFIPFLEEKPQREVRHLRATEEKGTFPHADDYRLRRSGEARPVFERHDLLLDLARHRLRLVDRASGEDRWAANLTRSQFANIVLSEPLPPASRVGEYQTVGSLVILPLGEMVFAIDPLEKKVVWERDLRGKDKQARHVQTVRDKDGVVELLYADGVTIPVGGPVSLGPSAVVLLTRDGLVALEPVTGRVLWARPGLGQRPHVFGDSECVCVVSRDRDGKATRTAVLSATDGRDLKARDFAAEYDRRVRLAGRRLLVHEAVKEGEALRLYDPAAGKDDWERTFAAKSLPLTAVETDAVGMAEPNGKVFVLDEGTGRLLCACQVDPKYLAKVRGVYLLADRERFYVACDGPADPDADPPGGARPNVRPGGGLRALPVNGEVYCFDAATGKTRWHNPFENQAIVLNGFAESPVLLATSRYKRFVRVGTGRLLQETVGAEIVNKAAGKYLYKQENPTRAPFHTLHVDADKGRVELVSDTLKIVVAPPP